MLFVECETDIEPTLTYEAQRIWRSYCGAIVQKQDPRVMGLICHLFTPTFIRTQDRLIVASQFDVFTGDVESVLPLSADEFKLLLKCL